MPDIYFDVDAAISECPVNIMPLLDDTDFKTRETAIAYNAAGMDLVWNFVTSAGAFTQTAVTPTTAGDYDWTHQGDGMYTIEIPASGGASINNDTEGYGWFTGLVTGVLPWRGPIIGFRAAALNDALCDGGDLLDTNTTQWNGTAVATPTVAGVPEVDVTHWIGTACATPTVAGVPEVDLTHIGGDAQSGTDLKDFADAGYDPATNKVQGVVLVDTLTTYTGNTPQTGDSYARIGAPAGASVSADIAGIQSDTNDIQTRIPAVLYSGTADSGTTTTMVDAARTEADTDYWKGQVIVFTSGTIAGQARLITGFTPGTDTITFSPATTQAVGTNTYEIWPGTDVILAQLTHTSAVIPTVSTLTGHTAQTGDCYAEIVNGTYGLSAIETLVDGLESTIGAAGAGLTALATQASVNTIDDFLDTEIAAIKAVTDAIGATGAGLTAIPWNAAWDTEVQSECADALTAYDPPTNAEMEARTPTAAQLAYIVSNAADGVPVTFTGGTTTTAVLGNVDGSAASSTDDYYNGRILVFNAGTLDNQVTDITDYVGSTKTATITAVTTAVTSSHTANLK